MIKNTLILISALMVSTNAGTIVNADLTKGTLGGGTQTGGTLTAGTGWRVTAHGQRVIWDVGYKIKNGSAEVVVATKQSTTSFGTKINWFGIAQIATKTTVTQKSPGPKAYLRSGNDKYDFSRWKAGCVPFLVEEQAGVDMLEHDLGSASMWKTDDKSLVTVKMEWKDGQLKYTGPGGPFSAPQYATQGKFRDIQYIYVGGCTHYGESLIGMRVLSVKVEDFDKATNMIEIKNRKSKIKSLSMLSSEFNILGVRKADKSLSLNY